MSKISKVEPISVSYSEPNDNGSIRSLTFCRIETSDGIVGWGEAVSTWPEACWATEAVISGMSDLLLGRDPLDNKVIYRDICSRSWWYGPEGIAAFARSAIDIALWDLRGKVSGQSLITMLGGGRSKRRSQ